MPRYPENYRRLQALANRLRNEHPIGFSQLNQKALADGALDRKHKELMCLAISVSQLCEGCIAFHVHDSLRAGASYEEVMETLGVAILMGGGPALIYACEALEALDEFQMESDIARGKREAA